jgi:hypothetical protein
MGAYRKHFGDGWLAHVKSTNHMEAIQEIAIRHKVPISLVVGMRKSMFPVGTVFTQISTLHGTQNSSVSQ